MSIGIPKIDMNAAARMTPDEQRLVRQGIRDKYAMPIGAVQSTAPPQTEPSTAPVESDIDVETDAAATKW